MEKKKLGQYFTVSNKLQQFVFDRVKYKSEHLLEPSFGAGHLLLKFIEYDARYPMTCYELDDRVEPLVSWTDSQSVKYCDFTKETLDRKFKTIIGNPPYVKQRSANLYIKFIELCYEYLEPTGELIFIVPSDFIKLTSAAPILETMTKSGSFTDFWFPNNEKLFDGANIDVMVFRYEKGLKSDKALVNDREVFCNVNRGIVTFSDHVSTGAPIEEKFHVYVGLVSGRDEIYRAPFGNVDILNDKDRIEKFIFVETFPSNDEQINAHLETHKDQLLARKIKKFTEVNWFEWGAPRNLDKIRKFWGTPCIYVRNMTRNREVAFHGTVQYFGGSLLCLIPKDPGANLDRYIEYLNTATFQQDYLYAGRFKIGHKQISSAKCEISLCEPSAVLNHVPD
jgi:adenine-specific DNA-methyltransferase